MQYAKPAKSTICLNVSNVIGSSFEFCQNNRSAQSCRSVWGRDRQFISEFPSEFKFRSEGRQSSGGQHQVSNCRIWKLTPFGDRHLGVISALGVSGLHCLHLI